MLFSNKRLPLAAAITAFVAATPVAAQQLEEVIVTAQKRAENLQDVPISVSTVSGEKIQDNTILNFSRPCRLRAQPAHCGRSSKYQYLHAGYWFG